MSFDNTLKQIYELVKTKALENPKIVGFHQANALLNMAFNLKIRVEPKIFYEFPRIYGLPITNFYNEHADLIIKEIDKELSVEWLQEIGLEKCKLYNEELTDKQRKDARLVSDHITYYLALKDNIPYGNWHHVKATSIEWVDGRRLLERSRKKTKHTEALVKKLNTTKCFETEAFKICRHSENIVRITMNLPKVGEGWISETELFYRISTLLPQYEVIQHGRPSWLGRQHFDIWIPEISVAIEYQGAQHYEPISRFGGESQLTNTINRDQRKKQLCQDHNVKLIEIKYDDEITDAVLLELIY